MTAAKRPLSLYLIRHGETEWSLSGKHTGRTDIPLTSAGEEEARALQSCLKDVPFERVLTSPLQRARQTCILAGLASEAHIEPDLQEWDYGDYEGKRTSDVQFARSGWAIFRDGCPGGETPEMITERADRLIARLCSMSGKIALFSHGEFSLVLAVRWIGLPLINGQHFLINTGSINILGFNPAHPETPVIALWNSSPLGLDRVPLSNREPLESQDADKYELSKMSGVLRPHRI